MVSLIRRFLRDEGGFTLIEMSVGLILSSMIVASVVGVFYAFSQNASDSTKQAELQRTLRSVASEIVLDLRQAEAVRGNGDAVETMADGHLVLYTDRAETPGPERVRYERIACDDGNCELWVRRYAAVTGSGPDWDFAVTPFQERFLVGMVRGDAAVFTGYEWTGDPKVKTALSACGGGGQPDCDMPLVQVRLRAMPINPGPSTLPFEVLEEVRLRNVP